jgi:GNAT superfamily N-acetyltransferase
VHDETIDLLADRPDLISAVGMMRCQEWGRGPEPDDPQWWVNATRREAGRDGLPVTYVAVNGGGEMLGAVGLGEFDLSERRDRSPWILGMVVRAELRGTGVGRRLLRRAERRAAELGFAKLWVANEGPAVGFYERCGYRQVETLLLDKGVTAHVLTRSLQGLLASSHTSLAPSLR